MDVFEFSEKLMSMDDETWTRHANPISVYSRFTCLPLIALAIWSRVWIGWWCLLPLVLTIAWVWINPRIAKPVEPDDVQASSWAYRGVMGERIFLDRKNSPIPEHHMKMGYLLTALSVIGVLILIFGLYQLNIWAVVCGMVAAVGAKTWFVDRMVWLYDDRKAGC